jgi:lysyl-tRNA synthetase class I
LTEADPRFEVFDAAILKRLIEDLLEEHYTLPLLKRALNFLIEKPRAQSEPWLPELRQMLRSSDPWSEENLNRELRAFMKERGLKGKEFFHPLRLILTGMESGAALTLILCVLGRDRTVERLG